MKPAPLPSPAHAADTGNPLSAPRARTWTWAVTGFASVICALFVTLHFHQRQALDDIARAVDGMRLARIELARALDAATVENDAGFERDQALGLAHQAIAGLATTLDRLPDAGARPDARLPDDIEALRDEIELWRHSRAGDAAARTRLRLAFHRVERRADLVDSQMRDRLRQLDDRQAGQFRAAAVLSGLLLLGIGVAALGSARLQRSSGRALLQSQRLFETLARISPVGIYRTDAFGNEVYANLRCREIRGQRPGSSAPGFDASLHPDDRERVRARWLDSVEDMRDFQAEYRLMRAGGGAVWVLNQAVPEIAADGTVLGYVGTLADITGRKRAELLADSQRAVLELIAGGKPLPIALGALIDSIEQLDPELICLVTRAGPDRDSAPEAHARRWPATPLLALQIATLAARGDSARRDASGAMLAALADASLAELPPDAAALLRETGLRSLWHLPIGDGAQPLGALTVFRRSAAAPGDEQRAMMETAAHTAAICLQRHRDEAALRDSEQRFRQLAQSLPQLVWSGQPDGRCDFLGQQWQEYTGEAPDDLLGFRWLDRVHPDDQPALLAAWEATCPSDGLHAELRLCRHDGHYRWFDVRALPLLDDAGRVLRWFGTGTDVTESRMLRDALHRANAGLELKVAERTAELSLAKEQAEASNRLKSEFLASMSHELRTPLHAILGFTDMLMRGLPGPLNPVQQRQLGNVQTSARHLLSLINDLLDVARIESGKTQLHIAEIDAGPVLAEAVEVLRQAAAGKGVELDLRLPPTPVLLLADRRALYQIVINLLGNAIKFTERGWVRIEVATDADRVALSFVDTGCGIAPDDQARLFEAFTQASPGRHHAQGGTGLGLFLCRQLAALHQGEITLDSTPGTGSRFTLSLPTPGAA